MKNNITTKLLSLITIFVFVFTGVCPAYANETIADIDLGASVMSEQPIPLFYNKVTFGETSAQKSLIGNMDYYMYVTDDAPLEKKDDNLWYAKEGCGSDSLGNHALAPDNTTPAYFITKYKRSDRDNDYPGGYLYFEMGEDITTEDKEFYVEAEVYGTDVTNVSLQYNANANNERGSLANGAAVKTVNGEWTTLMFHITDAYFNGEVKTGYTPGGWADFRIEANRVDTYIKSVAVSNCEDPAALLDVQNTLDLGIDGAVSESFVLPTEDDVDISWSSSNEAAVYIEDGSAVVVTGRAEQEAVITAKIEKDGYYVEKAFDITVAGQQTGPDLSDAQKLIYNKVTYGATASENVYVGLMTNFAVNSDETPLEQVDGAWTDVNGYKSDSLGNYTQAPDGTSAYFITKYKRPQHPSQTDSGGFVYFKMGEDVTVDDKEFYVDVEVYGDNSKLTLLYINKDNPADSAEIPNSDAVKVKNGDWTTLTFHVTDAMFNGVSDTGLADQKADFRLQANGEDTYIKSVAVYNSADYEELLEIKDTFELERTEDIALDFELPTIDGCEIEWTSSDEEVIYIDDNTAVIVPDFVTKSATLTAKIAKDGYYVEKAFEVTLAAMEKTAISISEPVVDVVDGVATVTVDVEDANYYGKDIYLYAIAKDKSTGKLNGIGYDYIAQGTVTDTPLTASVNLGANDVVEYLILNGDGASIKNHRPSKVTDVEVVPNFDKVTLKWGAAYDDYEFVAGYGVLKDGSSVFGTTEESERFEYTAKVVPDNKYNFEILAYDHMNAASDPYAVEYQPKKYSEINLADPDNDYNGMTLYFNGNPESDCYYEKATKDGVKCVKTRDRAEIGKAGRTMLYFKVDEDVVNKNNNKVSIEITYYDNTVDKGALAIMYYGTDGTYKGDYKKPFEGTEKWVTKTFTFDDVKFSEHSGLSTCDFRIGATHGDLYVSRVRVVAAD